MATGGSSLYKDLSAVGHKRTNCTVQRPHTLCHGMLQLLVWFSGAETILDLKLGDSGDILFCIRNDKRVSIWMIIVLLAVMVAVTEVRG